MADEEMEEIEKYIDELKNDSSTPKNVRSKIEAVSGILQAEGDLSINVSKALNMLEEIADDINIDSFTRTQIWNLVSLLEKMC